MVNKLLLSAFVLLLALSLRSQNKMPQLELNNPVNTVLSLNGTDIIVFAKKYLGTPYSYASTDPLKGFDCSGFVSFVFKNFNINLPRSSRGYESIGYTLKPEEFKVGDVLVFYGYNDFTNIGHVGIICEANGLKSKFIHSTSGKAMGVTISELGSDMYTRRFYKCINVTSLK